MAEVAHAESRDAGTDPMTDLSSFDPYTRGASTSGDFHSAADERTRVGRATIRRLLARPFDYLHRRRRLKISSRGQWPPARNESLRPNGT